MIPDSDPAIKDLLATFKKTDFQSVLCKRTTKLIL